MGLSSPKQIHAAPLGAAFLLATLGTAQAQDLRLVQPIDCSLGTDCVIQQYVDHDAGPSASDFRCGPQSYDGHKGTDFRLLDESDLGDEVAVLAAAAGTVTGLRDGMADHLQSWPNAPDITGRECGNGLVIDHGNGWETQYCHLAQGSLAVTPTSAEDSARARRNDAVRPTATPTKTSAMPWRTTWRRTSFRSAPTAMRMPISRRRRPTVWETTP